MNCCTVLELFWLSKFPYLSGLVKVFRVAWVLVLHRSDRDWFSGHLEHDHCIVSSWPLFSCSARNTLPVPAFPSKSQQLLAMKHLLKGIMLQKAFYSSVVSMDVLEQTQIYLFQIHNASYFPHLDISSFQCLCQWVWEFCNLFSAMRGK